MVTVQDNTRRLWSTSLAVFAAFAIGIPWSGWSVMLALHLQSPWRHPSVLAWALWLSGSGVSLGGLVATCVDHGWSGVQGLLRRVARWRVGLLWWCVALFGPFLWAAPSRIIGLVICGQSVSVVAGALAGLVSPIALLHIITGPLGEELGWRGFLLPKLLQSLSPLAASLLLGVLWSFWHIPIYLTMFLSQPVLSTTFVVGTAAMSLILTSIMIGARWSLLLAIIFHWAGNVVPGVVDQMFPGAPGPRLVQVQTSVELGLLVLVSVLILFVSLGPRRSLSVAV